MDAHDLSEDDGEWGHCSVCGEEKPRSQLVRAEVVRPSLASRIEADHPAWGDGDSICLDDLHRYRLALIRNLLTADQTDELSGGEETVLGSLSTNEIVAQDVEAEFRERLTVGDRLADGLSEFAGSWTFIVIFAGFMAGWILLNVVVLVGRAFDPYPFILLNLLLSTLAAIQAPVIMMSQNRQEARDRVRAEHDYEVNLKSELEIQQLQEKLDHLRTQQWHHLLEIQEAQAELIDELSEPSRES